MDIRVLKQYSDIIDNDIRMLVYQLVVAAVNIQDTGKSKLEVFAKNGLHIIAVNGHIEFRHDNIEFKNNNFEFIVGPSMWTDLSWKPSIDIDYILYILSMKTEIEAAANAVVESRQQEYAQLIANYFKKPVADLFKQN